MMDDLVESPVKAPALGPLGYSMGFLLRMAQVEAFAMYYASLDRIGMKPGEFSVIYVIHENPGIRQGVLAERLHIKRAHMTKLIRGFETRGLVARHIPDDDRRAVELTLTAMGADFVTENAGELFAQGARESARLAPDEARQLISLLRKFTGLETT